MTTTVQPPRAEPGPTPVLRAPSPGRERLDGTFGGVGGVGGVAAGHR